MKRILMLAAALLAAPAAAQTVAITNGRVAIGDGSPLIQNGTVLIRNGRVVAAGSNVAIPADAQRIDAQGRWVTPGIIAGLTQLGLAEVGAIGLDNDTGADKSPFSAAIDVAPAINSAASSFAITRARGVTRAFVAPDTTTDIFGGQGALINTSNDTNVVDRARLFQYVELGEQGTSRAGGSRGAAHVWFRNAMLEARDYARNPSGYSGGRDADALLMRADVAALVPVMQGRMPLLVRVNRAADILQVLALRSEFPNLKLVLVDAAEGWMVARQIAAAGIPVITSALTDLPDAFESLGATQSNFGRMRAAGVKVALGEIGAQPRNTKQSAGNLVALAKIPGAEGLSWDDALAAATSWPAEAFGLGGEFGSLRPGRRGDVVIWDGDPLELATAPVLMLIDGVQQPLETRQTKLRDRYRTPQEGVLPKAYER
ncbi:MAG: amidohydrolase family protein [Sphingosinicella sp.]|nr:amidohydrolase family protein [Sphingosinicella sp.]